MSRITVKGPVIIAMNHPNAFTDPIVLSYLTFPLRLKYLARGDVFKPGFVSTMLEIIGIVPIFRIQDAGKEGLKKNDESYQRVNSLLKKNCKVIVFAEGLCVQERRLRPLKKGVARMVFGAYESIHNENLMVLPIGIHYDKPHQFRSHVYYNVGEPILAKDYIEDYRNNAVKTNKKFLEDLRVTMKSLIAHIDDKSNDEVVYMIEELCKTDWMEQENLNLKDLNDDFKMTKKITNLVNQTATRNQPGLDDFKEKAKSYFNKLKKKHLQDWLINPKQSQKVKVYLLVARIFLLTICAPIYLVGLIGNFLALLLTHFLTRKIIKSNEFYSSIALGLGMIIFLLNYVLIYFISHSFTSNAVVSCFHCFLFIIAGFLSLHYHSALIKTRGLMKIIFNTTLANELKKEREILITLINNF